MMHYVLRFHVVRNGRHNDHSHFQMSKTVYYLVQFVEENNDIGITRSEWVRPTGCTDFKPGDITYTMWPKQDYSCAIKAKDAMSVKFRKGVFKIKIVRVSGTF